MTGLPPADELLAFAGASLLLALAPGPDNLFVLSHSALYGRRGGLLITLGLCSGLLVHSLVAALGVVALILAKPAAFFLLKALGAAYLLALAWNAWRSGFGATPRGSSLRGLALWRRGILMNLGNPKVALFFLAFLPQFADPAHGPLAGQMLWLGGIFMLCALLVFGLLALLAAGLAAPLRESPRLHILLNRVAALLFAALALRLLWSAA